VADDARVASYSHNSPTALRLRIAPRRILMDGEPRRIDGGGSSSTLFSGSRSATSIVIGVRDQDRTPASLGFHEAIVEVEVTISLESDPSFAETFIVPFRTRFEVIPDGADAIELVTDDALGAELQASLRNLGPAYFLGANWNFSGYGWIQSQPRGIPLAMDVYWRTGESPPREFKVATIAEDAHPEPHTMTYSLSHFPRNLQPGTVRVFLRPSIAAAKGTTNLTRIWGREIDLGELEVMESTDGSVHFPRVR
jgi:hypothetical protein